LIAVGSLWGDKLGPAIQPLRGNIRQLACQPSANVRCRAAVDGHFKNQTTLTPLVLTPLVPFVPARRCSGLLCSRSWRWIRWALAAYASSLHPLR